MIKPLFAFAGFFISVLQGQNINFFDNYLTVPVTSPTSCTQLSDSSFVIGTVIFSPSTQTTFCPYLLKINDCGDSLAGIIVDPVTNPGHTIAVNDLRDLHNGTFLVLATEYVGNTDF